MRSQVSEIGWRMRLFARRIAFAIPPIRRSRFRARTHRILGWMADGDHRVQLTGDTWELQFPTADPRWPLLPQPIRFHYVPSRRSYSCLIGSTEFRTASMPLFEILNELRGYCILGKPAPGDTCLDLGAGSGMANVYLSARIQGGSMFALEPDPRAARLLREDLHVNRFHHARVIEAAVAPHSGIASFDLRSPGTGHVSAAKQGSGDARTVRAMTLHDLVASAGGRVDYLKADIEGMEAEIAEQLAVLIRENRIRLAAIASYHRIANSHTAGLMESVFRRVGGLCAKTVYPRHPTTIVARSDDAEIEGKLSAIPATEF